MCCSVLQCVAICNMSTSVCCSMLQDVAVCCSVLQGVVVRRTVWLSIDCVMRRYWCWLQHVGINVLQCVLQRVALRCSVLQFVAQCYYLPIAHWVAHGASASDTSSIDHLVMREFVSGTHEHLQCVAQCDYLPIAHWVAHSASDMGWLRLVGSLK